VGERGIVPLSISYSSHNKESGVFVIPVGGTFSFYYFTKNRFMKAAFFQRVVFISRIIEIVEPLVIAFDYDFEMDVDVVCHFSFPLSFFWIGRNLDPPLS
jgi:hypothetical protein